jgi:O-antigen/teichoic acid export membrane protein
LLTSIVLARLFPDKLVVTQYEQLLLLGGAMTFFWVSGLFDGFVVLYRGGTEPIRKELIAHTFLTGFVLALLSGIACYFLGRSGIAGDLSKDLLLPFSLFLFLDLSSQMMVFYLLVKGQSRLLLVYGFVTFLSYFLLLALPLWLGMEFSTALWMLCILGAVKLLLLILVTANSFAGMRLDGGRFIAILQVSGPIALAVLLSQSAQYVDSFLVESRFPDQFAVFRYGAKELPLVLLLANAMSIVRAGDISESIQDGTLESTLEKLKSSALRLIHSMFPLSMVLLFFSGSIFAGVFGPGFAESVPVFDLYLLLVIPRLLFPQSVIRGHLRTLAMSMSAGVELVLNITLSLVFMEYWGIAGIAAATVVAFMVEKLILVIWCKSKLKLSPGSYTPLLAWGAWSLAIIALWGGKYVFMQ